MDKPVRKTIRLKTYDYNSPGYYFLTICTKEKEKLFGDIVGTVLPDGPQVRFTEYGCIVNQQLQRMSEFYEDMRLENYVVMPNHIHILLRVLETGSGPSGRTVPTSSKVGRFVGTLKRFTNRSCGRNLWQNRSYDHVIRGEEDYREIWNYIEGNPSKWVEDRFYIK